MHSLSKKTRPCLAALALVFVCVAGPRAAAQADPLQPNSVVLDRKRALKLLLSQVKPDYPGVAKVNYIQGHVRVHMLVTPEGRVSEVHVVRGHPFLAASALAAVRRWRYRPLIIASVATAFQTFVDVNFALRSRKMDSLPIQPEKDLLRGVQPPEILDRPPAPAPASSVRIRILLSEKGKVLDTNPVYGPPARFDAARKDVEGWKFQPARWGSLNVPWYLDVDVPVEKLGIGQEAGDPGGR